MSWEFNQIKTIDSLVFNRPIRPKSDEQIINAASLLTLLPCRRIKCIVASIVPPVVSKLSTTNILLKDYLYGSLVYHYHILVHNFAVKWYEVIFPLLHTDTNSIPKHKATNTLNKKPLA